MKPPAKRQLHIPSTLAEALGMRERLGPSAEYFAGGTWIMRADLRQEFDDRHYIAIGGLKELAGVAVSESEVTIGSAVTHGALADAIKGMPALAALSGAAAKSANPAIRQMATIGGNLCTRAFAAADLAPALLCLEADVELALGAEIVRMPLAQFLAERDTFTGILLRIVVPRQQRHSAHARLPLKQAGDYPVAIVSASISLDPDGRIAEAVIAVGSVEQTARRWPGLEAQLAGRRLNASEIAAMSVKHIDEFSGRDGVEAPGWYRVKVLPELVRRAFADLLADTCGG
ncbi:FAD-binding molybdopterin dehydrogenase [Agrobacterium tumefaciens]|uniref:FAD binding domain-containing protein n=1 Tax=Agrobacterium tumefaciens TaxID=358 RepID=UPI001573E76D|nr:FAD binding domain-containing protein [Agrobacterium tumefaciens]NTB94961.1 FAD-binding molybdopterin dehydrogenase [Agrobacterium tumefaciens]NTC44754.1 FAD-binding molybdopterin dehydrogenase [Agrobacterium tumefaciens]UXT20555.1 FAD-binding molybdopterin dehydrogenase [Agrobacterium tumefaciens]